VALLWLLGPKGREHCLSTTWPGRGGNPAPLADQPGWAYRPSPRAAFVCARARVAYAQVRVAPPSVPANA
jgi:hypothetical protein